MRKYLLFIVLSLSVGSNTVFSALLKTGDNVELHSDCTLQSDLYMFGQQVEVYGGTTGDLVACGQYIDIDGDVGRNLYSAGQRINMSGDVSGNFIGFAQDIAIEGIIRGGFRGGCNSLIVEDTVYGDIMAGAATIEIGREAVVTGNVYAGAGRLIIRGEVLGNVIGGAETFRLSGRIGKSVKLDVENVDFAPGAVIEGRFYYKRSHPFDQDFSDVVKGDVSHVTKIDDEDEDCWMCLIWFLVSSLITVVIIGGLFKDRMGAGYEFFSRHGWMSLLVGFVSFIVTPVIALILLATVFGIPVGLILAAIYGILLYIGWSVAAIILGKFALRTAGIKNVPWFAAGIFGIIVLSFIGLIPVLGCFINFMAMLLGFGISLQLLHRLFWSKNNG